MEQFASLEGLDLNFADPHLGAERLVSVTQALTSKPYAFRLQASKTEIRTRLNASTLNGVFATVFSNVTGGVLLTHFLLKLGANPKEIGILASIPKLANLMQPIGAFLSEQIASRHHYCLWIYSLFRLLWVGLAIAILKSVRSILHPIS